MFSPTRDCGIYRTTTGGQIRKRGFYRGETTGGADASECSLNFGAASSPENHHVTYPLDEESSGLATGHFKRINCGNRPTDITRNLKNAKRFPRQTSHRIYIARAVPVYQAMKSLGRDTFLVVYPDGQHGVRRPISHQDLLHRFIGWLGKHVERSQPASMSQ